VLTDPEPEQKTHSWTRHVLMALTFLVVAAALFEAWVFDSRRQESRETERRAAAEKLAEDHRAVELMGGNRFEILGFYASPGFLRRGERAQLCYGVSNTKSIRIEPLPETPRPALSRCLFIQPAKTTTYTLTAEDAEGHSKTASLTVEVR
jgi:hypothetical protein